MRRRVVAVVIAAGRGRRMGADKALLELGGRPLIEHALEAAHRGGAGDVVVVRAAGAGVLPLAARRSCTVVEAPPGGEMIDSVRAGLRAAPATSREGALLLPVDHALAGPETVAAVLMQIEPDEPRIALPLWRERPGHPIAVGAPVVGEILEGGCATLREIVRRDPGRVVAVPVRNPWVVRDLDTPIDLAAARQYLRTGSVGVHDLMQAHRSRRAFAPDPVPAEVLARIVDVARHASTSAMIQAYSVILVTDSDRRARIHELCARQEHVRQAPVFLAVCADLAKIELACRRHGLELAHGGLEIFLQATVDAAILGQNLQLAIEAEGLGSCMIGAARNHPTEMARLLELPARCYVPFGMVVGHPTDDPLPRGRMPIAGVFHEERYHAERLEAALDGMDEIVRAWARAANARGGFLGRPVNEKRGWTDRMARIWGRADSPYARPRLAAELRGLGFSFD